MDKSVIVGKRKVISKSNLNITKYLDTLQPFVYICISICKYTLFIFMITFGVLGGLFSHWFYVGAAVGGMLFVGGIIFASAVCWPKEQKYSEELIEYRREHEEGLWAEATKDLKAYNEEQKKIAEALPLE